MTPPATDPLLGIPLAARRLLTDLAEPIAVNTLLERLLEDGDREDLRWLFDRFPESRVVVWFERFAGRRLSARSHAFWRLVLGRADLVPPAVEDLSWPS